MLKPICTITSNRELITQTLHQRTYYLSYEENKNPKKCRVGIRYPGVNSTPFVTIGGKRAKDIYTFITQLLENNGIHYSKQKNWNINTIELPLATGLASAIFLLSVYSSIYPLRYAATLERMILGKIPFTRYFVMLTELSMDLSNYLEEKHAKKQALNKQAAKTVSKMLLGLINGIERKEVVSQEKLGMPK